MNWRAAVAWTVLSLVAWFVLVALVGFLAGAVIQQEYDLQEIPLGQTGVLVPVVISMGLLPRLAVWFLLATSTWAFLARQIPEIEHTKRSLFASLASYAVAAGVLAWLAIPLNEPFATYGALLFAVCFVLPRLLTRRLSPGVFAA